MKAAPCSMSWTSHARGYYAILEKKCLCRMTRVPVVLNLIDNLHQTRRELRALTKAVEEQPENVRHSIVSVFQSIHVRKNNEDADDAR